MQSGQRRRGRRRIEKAEEAGPSYKAEACIVAAAFEVAVIDTERVQGL